MTAETSNMVAAGSSDNGSDSENIPTISLSPIDEFLRDPDQIQALQHAAFEVGFFYLDNHGIDQKTIDGVLDQTKALFQLPVEKKLMMVDRAMSRGYLALGNETLDPAVQKDKGDTKEGFYIGKHIAETDPMYDVSKLRGPNQWPSDEHGIPDFQPTMERYYQTAMSVGHQVVQMLAVALDVEPTYFDSHFENPITTLRLNRYEPTKSDPDNGIFACGAHSDYGMITLLLTDDNPGLQILTKRGEWIDVPPQPNKFVINLGDMLERWTNGKCRSTKHRVLSNGSRARYSAPVFYDPSFDALVECLDNCRDYDSGERNADGTKRVHQLEPITVGAHLLQKYEQTHKEFSNNDASSN
uniref:Fe2OG dioxygenase domain-containing protein n=1 Tax=Craspedostauros australis TaxID=1486917 RepID=A0A7S0F6B3_9STRA|mmetsp:Transcript_828/g.2351  ORF Transcript_828/g.2351 Transcript_828/m.2351 type:complete len:355 (+) Transcript_828:98-1162(+)|eukprot:CAMPEP_0198115138 /NCGR_PEP_ID=MMETSP1442-20131203/6326_1 /TAXON_ID= /ORGANISM="Craspedostauros australis, Strain CCMP3328" /LENGTH=354 /DNA_ID=CAMNT_0043772591 /DNA_START=54 /DNA_END=1118 /DNA_ORIENTATION=-